MRTRVLPLRFLRTPTAVVPELEPWLADPEDAALSVMTDFRTHPSVSVAEDAKVDHALKQLKLTGVRAAFVAGEKCYVIVGLITVNDLCGDKLAETMRLTGLRRRQVLVRDVMEPIQHCRVVETDAAGRQRLRGMLSYARVKRVLASFEAAAVPAGRAITSGPWYR